MVFRRLATLAAVLAMAVTLVAVPSPTVAETSPDGGSITLFRSHDPETNAAGIQIVYRWDTRFGRRFAARVRLFEGQRLVGQIPFSRGWDRAPAFFRTSPSSRRHAFRAVGQLLRRDGTVVAAATERSDVKYWRRTVQPGQVVY